MTTVSYLTLRDLAYAALAKQPIPATVSGLIEAMAPFWTGEARHVHRVLRELEERGLAVRQKGAGARPGGGRAPDLWHTVR
ncbi:hypothetical protein N4P33_15735 [Streptomyces sp. 15-116A]|uniref:hypothetical protein n=1 Tax=Streptomyces sp. 15-116A TaxID=2259035 RepID=UPI0021B3D4AB|nr:hypothetical protein [Streptomyces sp. 15-116A]MCT7353613.1 hypothetical protein [Streptomyces sp. 15-116A]